MSWLSYWFSYKNVLESRPTPKTIKVHDMEEESRKLTAKFEARQKLIKDKIKDLFKVEKVVLGYGYDGWTYAEEMTFDLNLGFFVYKRKYIVIDSIATMFYNRLDISVYEEKAVAEEIAKFIAELDGHKDINIRLYKKDDNHYMYDFITKEQNV